MQLGWSLDDRSHLADEHALTGGKTFYWAIVCGLSCFVFLTVVRQSVRNSVRMRRQCHHHAASVVSPNLMDTDLEFDNAILVHPIALSVQDHVIPMIAQIFLIIQTDEIIAKFRPSHPLVLENTVSLFGIHCTD